MIYLPDVNVWIALAADKHIHHNVAKHWFTNIQADQVLFCRITQLGFLRLLTNRHVMGDEVLSPNDTWRAYRALRADRRIGYLSEPAELPRDRKDHIRVREFVVNSLLYLFLAVDFAVEFAGHGVVSECYYGWRFCQISQGSWYAVQRL